ncbi:uncharacterized protein BCR38DRAFT_484036 [Pseudomassariella vexata]|uniref:Uncharacterized protein n=1 Tax=Pseudomassariella vexata TaxID=1141098 RepID=A0A1Y2E4B4_9PEZI|nr:uncharacterized protein BCR38DRAFT_484036 [Pseudomassariella vexata]ORY66403.1 hypothetical protein BCR38DRAFT_484036 [Pseudomassariella vexata]
MPHPFSPEDFPINEEREFDPTRTIFLKQAIHFKKTAQIFDVTGKVRKSFNNFSHSFLDATARAAKQAEDNGPTYEIKSCGDMMRTIKTMTDNQGEKVCDLNITFISFDCSTVRFPSDSKHSRHPIEIWPVDDGRGKGDKHECFVRHSVPYFWDMTSGPVGVLHKCLNQQRVEVAKVVAYGFDKDAILVLDGDELDDAVAVATCVILLNGRDSMDH